MKTLPLFLLSAIAAFVALPVSFEIGISLLFATSLVAVLLSDYARFRNLPRLTLAPGAAIRAAVPRSPLGLAA